MPADDERLSNLLARVEEKVEKRKNRRTKNKERFRKLLLRVNKIAEGIRQIANVDNIGVQPDETPGDVGETDWPPTSSTV